MLDCDISFNYPWLEPGIFFCPQITQINTDDIRGAVAPLRDTLFAPLREIRATNYTS